MQWVGDPLETILFELMLHASFTNPAVQLVALEAAAADHQARSLVLGNGEHRGYLVITSLSVVSRQLDAKGAAIAIQARLMLTQSAPGSGPDSNAPPVPWFTPIAVLAPSSTTALDVASLSAAGVSMAGLSAMLNNPSPTGPSSAQLTPDDVPLSVIVRNAGTLQ